MVRFPIGEAPFDVRLCVSGRVAKLVPMIRGSKELGRGSCSTYDECYDDAELGEEIAKNMLRDYEMYGKVRQVCEEFRAMVALEKKVWEIQAERAASCY